MVGAQEQERSDERKCSEIYFEVLPLQDSILLKV